MIKLPRLLVVVAVAAAACGNKDSSPPSNGVPLGSDVQGSPECVAAIGGAFNRATAGLQKQLDEREGSASSREMKERIEHGFDRALKRAQMMNGLLVKHCTEDKWPSEVLDCMSNVSTRAEMVGCLGKLPRDVQLRASSDLERRGDRRRGSGAPPGMQAGQGDEGEGNTMMQPPPATTGSAAAANNGSAAAANGSAAAANGSAAAAAKGSGTK